MTITGQTVQYFNPAMNEGDPIAAIITRVNTVDNVDLVIFPPGFAPASRANVKRKGDDHVQWWQPLDQAEPNM